MYQIAIISVVFLCAYAKMFWGIFMTGSEDNFFTVKDSLWMNDTYFADGISGVEIREIANDFLSTFQHEIENALIPFDDVENLLLQANQKHANVIDKILSEGDIPTTKTPKSFNYFKNNKL